MLIGLTSERRVARRKWTPFAAVRYGSWSVRARFRALRPRLEKCVAYSKLPKIGHFAREL